MTDALFTISHVPGQGLNPLTRLAFFASLILLAFIAPSAWCGLGLFLVFILPMALLVRSAGPMVLMIFKFMLPFCIFLFPVHGLLVSGTAPFVFHGMTIYMDGLAHAALISTRILVMLTGFYLLFTIIHPATLIKELVFRGFPWGPAYVICATLQFLPRMKKRAKTIQQAQQARGLDISGNLLSRIKALIPLIIPLIFGALAEVENRALALELKNFNLQGQKTRFISEKDSRVQSGFRWLCLGVVLFAGGIRIWLF